MTDMMFLQLHENFLRLFSGFTISAAPFIFALFWGEQPPFSFRQECGRRHFFFGNRMPETLRASYFLPSSGIKVRAKVCFAGGNETYCLSNIVSSIGWKVKTY